MKKDQHNLWEAFDDANRVTMIGRSAAGVAVRVRDALVSIDKLLKRMKEQQQRSTQWNTHLQLLEQRVEQLNEYNAELLHVAAYQSDDRRWMTPKDKAAYEQKYVQVGHLSPTLFQIIKNRVHRFRQEVRITETFGGDQEFSATWRSEIEQEIDTMEQLISALLELSTK